MEGKLFTLIAGILFTSGFAQAQTRTAEQRPQQYHVTDVRAFIAAHPEHRSTFSNQGAASGRLICTDAVVAEKLQRSITTRTQLRTTNTPATKARTSLPAKNATPSRVAPDTERRANAIRPTDAERIRAYRRSHLRPNPASR